MTRCWYLRAPRVGRLDEVQVDRFAIETSYRQLHQARIRTHTRDPLLRLLYVGIALVLQCLGVHGEAPAECRIWD